MAYDSAVILHAESDGFWGGKLSVAASGGQFLVVGSNTLSATLGSRTDSYNYTKVDLAPGGSNNTVPVGYCIQNAGSGTMVSYINKGIVLAPAGGVVAAGDHLQVEGEATFRAVLKAVANSGIIGTALTTAASGASCCVQLNVL